MASSSAGSRLAALLAPAVARVGLDLEAVEVEGLGRPGRRCLLRVLVDRDGGVSLDDIAVASNAVSAVLDDAPGADAVLGGGPYVLEVSSPGVDRPLREPRHWRRARGRLVRVPLTAGGETTGRVVDVDDDGVWLAAEGASAGRAVGGRRFGFAELGPGRVQVEFNRHTDGDAEAFDGGTEEMDHEEDAR